MLKTTLVLVIEHSKPIPELTDLAAGRIYTLDGVEDVTSSLLVPLLPKWLRIKTAPVDTWILVFGVGRTSAPAMVARWDGSEWESADDGFRPYINPTHWMPLPAAPGQEAA